MSIESIIRQIVHEETAPLLAQITHLESSQAAQIAPLLARITHLESLLAAQNTPSEIHTPLQNAPTKIQARPPKAYGKEPKDTKIFQDYFKNDWDPNLPFTTNLDAICLKSNTNIGIYTRNDKTVIYECAQPYDNIQNFCVESLRSPLRKLVIKPMNDLRINSRDNNVPATPQTTKELAEINSMLDIKATHQFDVVRKLIYKSAASKITPLTDLEEAIAITFVRGDVHYLRETKDYTTESPAVSYDINSFHPYILQSSYLVPLREGRRHNSEKDTLDLTVPGLYFVDTPNLEFFRTTKKTDFLCLSNTMLQVLIDAQVDFELVTQKDSEESYNSYLYRREDCCTLDSLFGDSIRVLYDLKTQKNELAADVLQKIFGYLTKKTSTTRIVDISGDFEVDDEETIEHLGDNKIKISGPEEFTLPFGRIQIHFYDACRHYLYHNFIKGNEDDIVRIKVDSILYDANYDDILPISTKLGDVKKEYYIPKGSLLKNVNMSLSTVPNAKKYNPATKKFTPLKTP